MTVMTMLLGLLLVGELSLTYNNTHEAENNGEDIYQGPVPIEYDLEHFRKIGNTIKEVSS